MLKSGGTTAAVSILLCTFATANYATILYNADNNIFTL